MLLDGLLEAEALAAAQALGEGGREVIEELLGAFSQAPRREFLG